MKKIYKKIIKKFIKKNNFLKDLQMPFFSFNFVLIYIIHKMLVLIKNNLNYLKDSIFECFFKESIFLRSLILLIYFIINLNGKFKS